MTNLSSQNFRMVMKQTIRTSRFTMVGFNTTFIGPMATATLVGIMQPFFSDNESGGNELCAQGGRYLQGVRFGLGERTMDRLRQFPHYDNTLQPIPFDLDMSRKLLLRLGGLIQTATDSRQTHQRATGRVNSYSTSSTPHASRHRRNPQGSTQESGVKCTLKAMEWADKP